MVNPPLYSVVPDGVAEAPEDKRRSSNKAKPRFALPSDRMRFDKAVDALRATCALSKGGTEGVTAEMLAANLGMSPATAGLNNTFFKSVELITMASKGAYLPTKIAMDFYNKYSFDKEAAPRLLAPAFAATWFYETIKQKLEIMPNATRKQVVETLAGVAGTDASYSAQYGQLIDWLRYVELIDLEGDGLILMDEAPAEVDFQLDVTEEAATPASPKGKGATMPQAATPPLISLSLEITLTTEELSILDSKQIGDLFAGVAAIANAKARLDERQADET